MAADDADRLDAILTEVPRWRGGPRLSESGRLLWDVLFDAGAEDRLVPVEDIVAEFADRVERRLGLPGHIIRAYNAQARRDRARVLEASKASSTLAASNWWVRHTCRGWRRSGRIEYDGKTVMVLTYPTVGDEKYTPAVRDRMRTETLAGHREISRRDAFHTAVRGRTADELAEITQFVVTRLVRGSLDQPPRTKDASRKLRVDRLVRSFIDSFPKRSDPDVLDVELLTMLINQWAHGVGLRRQADK